MELWSILISVFGAIGAVYTGLHVYFKSKSSSKVESFKSIMEESKRFREEIRGELDKVKTEAKAEIKVLRDQIHQYEQKIQELEERLRDALSPHTWLYYYIQKPVKLFEIENILKRHLNDADNALIVGDDPHTHKATDEVAERNKWNFIKACNSTTAIDVLKFNQLKVIIIDLVLPVADVFEILNAIHENKKLSNIPLVVISSFNLKDVDRSLIHTKIHDKLTNIS